MLHMTALHDDPRVRRGMERQLELRRRMLGDGARPIGWKLGLGTTAAMEQHGTQRAARRLPHRSRPCASPAARSRSAAGTSRRPSRRSPSTSRRDVPPAADRDGGRRRDRRPRRRDRDRRHRAAARSRRSLRATSSTATWCSGRRVRRGSRSTTCAARSRTATTPSRSTSRSRSSASRSTAVAHLATHLAAFGETVRAGEVLITGSIVPAPRGRARRQR